MRTLFQNKLYRIVRTDPGSRPLGTIVYFHPVRANPGNEELLPFEEVAEVNFLTRAGFVGIFVQSARNDWFQHRSLSNGFARIRKERDLPRPLMSYGSSMGGFAAVAFASDVGADFFFAASPQASIAPAFMARIEDRRWRQHMKFFSRDRIMKGASRDMRGLLCYDRLHPHDRIHAAVIERVTKATLLHCPGSSHFALYRLQRDVGLPRVLADVAHHGAQDDSLRDYAGQLSDRMRGGFADRFVQADDAGRALILEDGGVDRLMHELAFPAIIDCFERDPTEPFARLLLEIRDRSLTEPHRQAIDNALRRKMLDHVAEGRKHGRRGAPA